MGRDLQLAHSVPNCPLGDEFRVWEQSLYPLGLETRPGASCAILEIVAFLKGSSKEKNQPFFGLKNTKFANLHKKKRKSAVFGL